MHLHALSARAVVLSALCAALILEPGCAWSRQASFPSPSGQLAIELWQTAWANEFGARFLLAGNGNRVALKEITRESLIYFVQVHWTPDESEVAILATGTGDWRAAYNVRTRRSIPFDQLSDGMADAIRQEYSLPGSVDPIVWSRSVNASQDFF